MVDEMLLINVTVLPKQVILLLIYMYMYACLDFGSSFWLQLFWHLKDTLCYFRCKVLVLNFDFMMHSWDVFLQFLVFLVICICMSVLRVRFCTVTWKQIPVFSQNFCMYVYHLMGMCCIVFDIDGMLFEFRDLGNIEKCPFNDKKWNLILCFVVSYAISNIWQIFIWGG